MSNQYLDLLAQSKGKSMPKVKSQVATLPTRTTQFEQKPGRKNDTPQEDSFYGHAYSGYGAAANVADKHVMRVIMKRTEVNKKPLIDAIEALPKVKRHLAFGLLLKSAIVSCYGIMDDENTARISFKLVTEEYENSGDPDDLLSLGLMDLSVKEYPQWAELIGRMLDEDQSIVEEAVNEFTATFRTAWRCALPGTKTVNTGRLFAALADTDTNTDEDTDESESESESQEQALAGIDSKLAEEFANL